MWTGRKGIRSNDLVMKEHLFFPLSPKNTDQAERHENDLESWRQQQSRVRIHYEGNNSHYTI